MKKIAIVIAVVLVVMGYSCKKEMNHTTIDGTLLTNGTNDKIRMSKELERPTVKLFRETSGIDIYPNGYEEVASIMVDENAHYHFDLDLKPGTYFIGFRNLDTSIYIQSPYSWAIYDASYKFNYLNGATNNINLYCLAKSWIRPRFINTNTDANNVDVFDCPSWGISFFGATDTTMQWIHRTWSGKYKYGVQQPGMIHKVEGKLTRNGVTKDVEIEYFAPPFDTTVVEIRY